MSQSENRVSVGDLLPDWSWCVKTIFLAGICMMFSIVYQPISRVVTGLYPSPAIAEKLELLDNTMDELGLQAYKPEKKRK
jgi:hypothetical protein